MRLILGDVQGHGLSAVQTAANVLGAFREAAYDAADLAEIAARIEASLQRQPTEEEFVTAVLAEISPCPSAIEILNCGHPPPLLLTGDAVRFIEPACPGLPLGLGQLMPSPRKASAMLLRPVESMPLLIDPISEARDSSGCFY